MKLWLFTFTDPVCKVSSCRVRAPDRIGACAAVEEMMKAVGQPVILVAMAQRPTDGVLLTYLGEMPGDQPIVVSIVSRDGTLVENEAA